MTLVFFRSRAEDTYVAPCCCSSPQEHIEVLTVDAWRPYVELGPVPNALLTMCLFLKDKKSRNYLVFALADSDCDLKHLLKEAKTVFPVCGCCCILSAGRHICYHSWPCS